MKLARKSTASDSVAIMCVTCRAGGGAELNNTARALHISMPKMRIYTTKSAFK